MKFIRALTDSPPLMSVRESMLEPPSSSSLPPPSRSSSFILILLLLRFPPLCRALTPDLYGLITIDLFSPTRWKNAARSLSGILDSLRIFMGLFTPRKPFFPLSLTYDSNWCCSSSLSWFSQFSFLFFVFLSPTSFDFFVVSGVQRTVHVLHNSEQPASVFAVLESGSKVIPLIADGLFDLLMLKIANYYTSKKQTKIECKGPRFEIGDFCVKLGCVTMSQNFKGVLVEVSNSLSISHNKSDASKQL